MIIFLYGKDDFRSRQKLKAIINRYREKFPASLSYQEINNQNFDLRQLKVISEIPALFQEKKLILLENIFALEAERQKELIGFLKKNHLKKDEKNIFVFYQNSEVDQRTALFKYLKKEAKSQNFSFLNPSKLLSWLNQFITQYLPKLKISQSCLSLLIAELGPDLWRLTQELKKIHDYQQSLTKNILKTADIENLVVFPYQSDIFKTIDAAAHKNKKSALAFLARHFKNLEPELKILAMFEYQFRSLVKIRALLDQGLNYYQAQKRVGLHPYAFKKMYELVRSFDLNQLEKIYDQLLELDIGFKNGSIQDKQIALEMFVIRLCGAKD